MNEGKKKVLEDFEKVDIKKEGIFQPFIVKFMKYLKASFYANEKVKPNKANEMMRKKTQYQHRESSINISPQNYSEEALRTYAIWL